VRRVLAAALAPLLFLLAGCAEVALQQAAGAPDFELSGRFALTYKGEGNSGNISWRYGAAAEELLITSPLGQGVARIVRNGGEYILTTPEPREFRAADAESLMERAVGVRLPLAGLADWVRARPAQGESQPRYDAQGRLAELQQAGWKVEYLEYADKLPMRLRLTYPGVELRLAITQWK
jgi:outer membrane lipoprotein LolB